jgi:hypothetical protein
MEMGRLVLSCYDGQWDAVQEIPAQLAQGFSDDLGNPVVEYGGFLHMKNESVIDAALSLGFFLCVRAVEDEILPMLDLRPEPMSNLIERRFIRVGWDVATGNGWRSASCDGLFPGDEGTNDVFILNEFSLIEKFEDCVSYCEKNNRVNLTMAPWYAVGVYVDKEAIPSLLEQLGSKTITRT